MAVRKQHNRYRTEPFGTDFSEVLKKSKAFFKDGTFMIFGGIHGRVWCASRLPASCFALPQDARIFTKVSGRWTEQ